MDDSFLQLNLLLTEVVLPLLKDIQTSQAQQRLQSDRLERTIAEFRTEMQMRFADIYAELVACRTQIEDTFLSLSEADSPSAPDASVLPPVKKHLPN
jgi:hypothetical protein